MSFNKVCPVCLGGIEEDNNFDSCILCGYFYYHSNVQIEGDIDVTNNPNNKAYNKNAYSIYVNGINRGGDRAYYTTSLKKRKELIEKQ